MGSKKARRISGHPGRKAEQLKAQSRRLTVAPDAVRPPAPRRAAQADSTAPPESSHPLGAAAMTSPATGQAPAHPGQVASQPRQPAQPRAHQRGWEETVLARKVDAVQSAAGGWAARALHGSDPQAVAATYTFTPPDDGGSASAVRFVGLREDVEGERGPRDVFDRTERLPALPAGTGEASLTVRVSGVASGCWRDWSTTRGSRSTARDPTWCRPIPSSTAWRWVPGCGCGPGRS